MTKAKKPIPLQNLTRPTDRPLIYATGWAAASKATGGIIGEIWDTRDMARLFRRSLGRPERWRIAKVKITEVKP